MDVNVRAELSENNKYWISRHRYYELKHFCMQYAEWKREYAERRATLMSTVDTTRLPQNGSEADPTANAAIALAQIASRIELIEHCAAETDSVLGGYVLIGVTKGIPYDILRLKFGVPCCKAVYYDFYRKFFWLLSKARN